MTPVAIGAARPDGYPEQHRATNPVGPDWWRAPTEAPGALDTFNPDNRCPYCGGEATFSYHQAAGKCPSTSVAHMHRRCMECEYGWCESPPSTPMKPR